MSPVVALVVDPTLRARVARSVGPGLELLFCERALQMRELVATHGALAVITELVDETGADTRPTIGFLSERLPGIQIVVIHDRPLPDPEELLELGRLGVSAWIHHAARDFTPALRAALSRAEVRTPSAEIIARALPLVPSEFHPFFVHCAHAAVQPLHAAVVARAVGFSPRTLRSRLARAGLPSPQRIIRWNRMMHVMWRLELSGMPVKAIAAPLGFDSDVGVRKHFVRATGLTIGEARARGGFRYLLGRYDQALRGVTGPSAGE